MQLHRLGDAAIDQTGTQVDLAILAHDDGSVKVGNVVNCQLPVTDGCNHSFDHNAFQLMMS